MMYRGHFHTVDVTSPHREEIGHTYINMVFIIYAAGVCVSGGGSLTSKGFSLTTTTDKLSLLLFSIA